MCWHHVEWYQEYIKCSLNISWYSSLNFCVLFSLFGTTKSASGQMGFCCPQRKILLLAGRTPEATLRLDSKNKHTSKKELIWEDRALLT